ncbi:NIPSNAP family protein [Cohnella yongneupensis]|uniref:NIPSNAP family protein n=1 Tax=Cohnella yongneupensis TaxID=425006 RepID=A0ABW0QU60_9BACL
MIYRRKSYKLDPVKVETFNQFFNEYLLPAQLKYGARLVGRWMTDPDETNTVEIFAIWEYDSLELYQDIEHKIKSDKEHVSRVQQRFNELGREYVNTFFKEHAKEQIIVTTVSRDKTILKG